MDRRAARVLLIDETGRVLLFRGCDPAVPDDKYWFSAGGGIDAGESPRQAAVRELREETGIHADPADFEGPVHQEITEFGFDGKRIRQEQVFFSLRIPRTSIDTSGFEAMEVATMDSHHWWSLDELRDTAQVIYPTNLVSLLDGILCRTS